MTDGPRALYERRDDDGGLRYVWQTPQEAWASDVAERGTLYALRSWYEYREMVATWTYYAATGGAPVLVDGPDDEGEWN
jgi:hypothetical protein